MRKIEQVILRQCDRIKINGIVMCKYSVIKTVNRLNPQIGDTLSEEQVRRFIVNTKASVTILS